MIPVLETPEIRHRAMPVSVKTWHWMQEHDLVSKRAELIRGVIVEKMSKSPIHTTLVHQLWTSLHTWSAGRYWVRKEDPLTFADSEPEPDISVVDGSFQDYTSSHPATARLVVEVSVSSAAADREMLPAYAAAGVTEVWLVIAGPQQIECYTHPVGESYQNFRLVGVDAELPSEALPGFVLHAHHLFPA